VAILSPKNVKSELRQLNGSAAPELLSDSNGQYVACLGWPAGAWGD
jgi:hypothetical protein